MKNTDAMMVMAQAVWQRCLDNPGYPMSAFIYTILLNSDNVLAISGIAPFESCTFAVVTCTLSGYPFLSCTSVYNPYKCHARLDDG